MKKAINKILTVITLSVLNTGLVFANGGDIYGTHDPIDTGLESGMFYLIACIFFTLGLLILSVVKTLKTKVSIK